MGALQDMAAAVDRLDPYRISMLGLDEEIERLKALVADSGALPGEVGVVLTMSSRMWSARPYTRLVPRLK